MSKSSPSTGPDATALVDPTTLRELFLVPPEEFVSRRNATVKALKASGDRPAAAAVATLRRPSVVDWALNVTAIEQPDLVGAFLDAGARLRDAQAAAAQGRHGDDVRGALQALRRQTNAVLTAANEVLAGAGRSSGPLAGPLTSRLSAVVGNTESADQLRAGRLGSADVEAESEDPFGGLAPASSGPGPRPSKATKPSTPAKSVKAPTSANVPAAMEADRADAVDPRRRRREQAAAARELAAARVALAKADADAAKAQRAVDDAVARVDAAHIRFEEAEQRRREAREVLERATAAAAAFDE